MNTALLLSAGEEGSLFQRIFPFILAIILIFLIPMLASSQGMTYGEFVRSLFGHLSKFRPRDPAEKMQEQQRRNQNRREPKVFNGHKNELIQLVSTLTVFARRNNLGLIYPGTIEYNGKTGNLVCILVTRHEAIGINCFGFGGAIRESEGLKDWKQHMNGQDGWIPNPLVLNKTQRELARRALDHNGMMDVPFRVFAIFTNKNVVVNTTHTDEVFTTEELIRKLRSIVGSEGHDFDPQELSKRINTLIVKVKTKK